MSQHNRGSLAARITRENPNTCANCGHPLQYHKIRVWNKPKKNVKGRRQTRPRHRSMPWMCLFEKANGEDCRCPEYMLARVGYK